jgi:hypothetical protein
MLSYCLRYVSVRRSALSIFSLFLVSFALGCSSGSSSSTTPAPANLVYPQTTVTVTVGQAIASNTPSVTGTVTSYSISPALPAGLTLNTSTGAISGTPTAAIASTTFTITATNSAGSTTATVQIVVNVLPPSGLSYPQTTISATVGQAIATDTPTVTGTVTSYTVAPALPAGLSLNSSTGAISGTPTAPSAQTTYAVTAANGSGSTTASLQITVIAAVAAPSALNYPQTAITGTAGQQIVPDIPSFTGSVTSFTITPALPAGMSLNTSNGTISGTPAAVLAQASYTVTASNAGGSTTAALTLIVNKAYATVLELGHADGMTIMRSTTDRLLSQDASGHWALWDAVADSELASGDQYFPYVKPVRNVWDVDMAGPTVAIGQPNGLEIRSSLDGHLLSIIAAPNMIDQAYTDPTKKFSWWKLASDGSYICAGSAAGLSVWSPGGQQLVVKQGDYSSARVFAAPGQVQVALGAAGQSVIETINVSSGASAVGSVFSGTFNSWFLDGQRFLTNTGNTVWTYSAASVQQAIVSLPSVQNLAGQGNWISTYSTSQLAVYAVGANSASATYQTSGAIVIPSGTTLGIIINSGPGSGSVVDLSGSAPVKTDFTTPFASLSAYTATSASKWFAANVHGVIVDGASANAARTLSFGQAWSITGGTTKVAIATANGSITYLNPATPTAVNTIAFSSSKLALSTDDTVLAAVANSNDFQYQPDRTLNVYSLPAGTTTISFPYTFSSSGPYPLDFALSGSGNVLGQILLNSSRISRSVSATTGGTPIWSDTFNPGSQPATSAIGSLQISPDGTLIAAASGPQSNTVGTNIYKNGVLVTAVPGWPLAWLDNSQLLVKSYAPFTNSYASSTVYDSSGAKLATPAIPELFSVQPAGSGQIYSSDQNSIFSLATGSVTWTGGLPSTAGAVAGQYVVFAKGSKVFLDTY